MNQNFSQTENVYLSSSIQINQNDSVNMSQNVAQPMGVNKQNIQMQTNQSYQEQQQQQQLQQSPQQHTTNTLNQDSFQQQHQGPPAAALTIIGIFEEILPVVCEDKPNPNDFCNEIPVNLNMYGKFESCFVNERKLTFKKREFFDVYDYIRELKMIKYKQI